MNSSYKKYLLSPEWRKIKFAVLDRDRHKCRICNSPLNLEVHHRTYPTIYGAEELIDLLTLCNYCHSLFHGKPSLSQKLFNKRKKFFKRTS